MVSIRLRPEGQRKQFSRLVYKITLDVSIRLRPEGQRKHLKEAARYLEMDCFNPPPARRPEETIAQADDFDEG